MRSYSRARATCPSLLTRISYQVGRPWMFDGKRFFPETGTPIRKIARINRLLALDDPVPLTFASLIAKSLTFARESGDANSGVMTAPGPAWMRTSRAG